jgi:hypothetical protein
VLCGRAYSVVSLFARTAEYPRCDQVIVYYLRWSWAALPNTHVTGGHFFVNPWSFLGGGCMSFCLSALPLFGWAVFTFAGGGLLCQVRAQAAVLWLRRAGVELFDCGTTAKYYATLCVLCCVVGQGG